MNLSRQILNLLTNGIEWIVEQLKNRFALFGTYFVIFIICNRYFTGQFMPSAEVKDLWFYSGIFMVLFSILFIEPYYSSPKNVITNSIPLLLVLLSIKSSFANQSFWLLAVTLTSMLLFASVAALSLADKNRSPQHLSNRISDKIKDWVILLGQGKFLYSWAFLYFLLAYRSIQDNYSLVLFALWFSILAINPKKIKNTFSSMKKNRAREAIGEIFGVQASKIFLVKMYEDRLSIGKFDLVRFRYSMQDRGSMVITGMVFDIYYLNQEMWAKILQLQMKDEGVELEKNVVYKFEGVADASLKIDSFVGVVSEGSTIGRIKFEYSKKADDLQEGDLLELTIGDRRLFYQVIGGSTEKEYLEARNETGFIEGEAMQLGEWQNDKLSFQKFGWVPSINSALFKADTSDIEVGSFSYPQFKLGIVPGTTLPSIMDLSDAVSHHLALLGVTGSGKSFLTNKIVKELLQDTKVICIDFTGEWKKKASVDTSCLISKDTAVNYLASDHKQLAIFELPALNNTTDVLKETQAFLELIFNYAKEQYDANTPVKVALVLEEAHTITPETSFLGEMGDFSSNKALVNKMTQVALQGRKYGIGLIVIAQRTANVSKTILTQCNTVICFQAFDETSFTFLGNYVGKDMVQTLPNLKQYHAVVAGKGIRSNLPMIVDLTQISE